MANDSNASSDKNRAGWIGCGVVLVIALMVAGSCGICVAITGDSEPDVSEEDRRFGFHCLDPWDGNHNGFERLVKPYLNDPSSMETHSTRMGALGTRPNGHSIVMEFGARNAFGGMVRHTAIGSVDNETCEATLESVN